MNSVMLAALAVMTAVIPGIVRADEVSVELKAGVGREAVMQNCLACHSLDYIVINGGIQGRPGWEATVRKMIEVMKAPISKDDAAQIVAYLAERYGNGT